MRKLKKKAGWNNESINREQFLLKQYDILSHETSMRINLLWNVPSLLFVATSFLLITSWDRGFSPWFRLLAAGLSTILCVCVWLLFERLWYFECTATEQMESIEKYFIKKFRGKVPMIHTSIVEKTNRNGRRLKTKSFTRIYRSHAVWRFAFVIMILISLATAVALAITKFDVIIILK